MMQDRRISFGLAATAIAMKARVGQMRASDQIGFATRALEWVHDDALARLAVVDFLTHCQRDPVGAGSRLQEFILDWADGDLPPQDPQLVLAGIFPGADTTRAVSFVSRRAS